MSCLPCPRSVVLLGMRSLSTLLLRTLWLWDRRSQRTVLLYTMLGLVGGREDQVRQVHCPRLLTNQYSQLLTLDEKDPKRLFEGNALIRRLVRVGVLDESRMKLDYVLALKVEDFLERRLQTCVFKLGLAKSIHHARVLIRQRHIRYGLQENLYVSASQRKE